MTDTASPTIIPFPLIAPSILASDLGHLASEIRKIDDAGADLIHIDVMDGQFVPPITFGEIIVSTIRKLTSLPLDVHLMINNPERQIESFANAGADNITIHIESTDTPVELIQQIHRLGKNAGISLNPDTPVEAIKSVIPMVDTVLVMSATPGWSGQKYLDSSDEKIKEVRRIIDNHIGLHSRTAEEIGIKHRNAGANNYSGFNYTSRPILLEVDCGINELTAKRAMASGADILCAGSFIFASNNYKAQIATLRQGTIEL